MLRCVVLTFAWACTLSAGGLAAQEVWQSAVFPDSLYARYSWQFFTLMVPQVHDTIDWYQPDIGLLNAAFFYATNKAREAHGSQALRFSPQLRHAAVFHAHEMLKHNFVAHDNPWNPPFGSLRQRSQFFDTRASGENVCNVFLLDYQSGRYFYRTARGHKARYFYRDGTPIYRHTYWSMAERMVQAFLDSPPHRRNMLSTAHRSLGCGTALEPPQRARWMPRAFGVQNFGRE